MRHKEGWQPCSQRVLIDAISIPPMFEPEAESMPADERAVLQAERLRGLIDRLLAAGGLQAGRLAAAGVTSGSDVSLGRSGPAADDDQAGSVGDLPVRAARGAAGGGCRRARVERDRRPADAGLLLPWRHRAVVQDVRAGAGRGRRRAGHDRAQRLRVRAVHRRASGSTRGRSSWARRSFPSPAG